MSEENKETRVDSLAELNIRLIVWIHLQEQEMENLNKKIANFEKLDRGKTNQLEEKTNKNDRLHAEKILNKNN